MVYIRDRVKSIIIINEVWSLIIRVLSFLIESVKIWLDLLWIIFFLYLKLNKWFDNKWKYKIYDFEIKGRREKKSFKGFLWFWKDI